MLYNASGRRVHPRIRIAGAALLVSAVLLGAVGGGIASAAKSPSKGGPTTTFTVTGKYHGTLTLSDPMRNCSLTNGRHMAGLGGASIDATLHGKLSGLSYSTWIFLASATEGGTNMIQKGLSQTSAYGASLQPVIPGGSTNLGFFASSGKITVGNQKGAATYKMSYDNGSGKANAGNVTISGTWDCPVTIQS